MTEPILPVEALDDLAWIRVERGIWARLDADAPLRGVAPPPARRRTPWLVAALAAAAVIVLVLAWPRGGLTPIPALPDRYATGASASSLTLDGVFVEVAPASVLVVARDLESRVATVESGSAWFTVAPRPASAPFIVLAGDTTVRVIGTHFRVSRVHEEVSVEVDHGVVEVTTRGMVVLLHDGERWPAAVIAAATAPSPAPVVAPPPIVAPPPAATPPPVTAPLMSPSEQARYERLTALEVRDPDAALAGYLVLARGTSAWAQLSLFAAARLAVDRGDARAASLLVKYLQRFPHGANTDDARELLTHLTGASP